MTVAIVGGGIAGLTAAAILAKQGQSVAVFEQAGHLGGRAETQTTAGFHFNLGPHALYRGGWAVRILSELGIAIEEGKVGTAGSFAYRNNTILPLPTGPASLLTTELFSIAERFDVIRFLGGVARIDPRPLATTPRTGRAYKLSAHMTLQMTHVPRGRPPRPSRDRVQPGCAAWPPARGPRNGRAGTAFSIGTRAAAARARRPRIADGSIGTAAARPRRWTRRRRSRRACQAQPSWR